MRQRTLGRSGLAVSALGLGCIALAWVLAQGDDVVPIFGTKRRTYLVENLAAATIHLTADELRRIDQVAPRGSAAGDRYPAAMMSLLNR
jgi:aryl-alcohol dehydrogenase-like predicted oxidoreductase